MNIYRTKGTCSREIIFNVDENDVLKSVKFVNGCSGNTQGISRLVVGHKIDEIIALLEGIQCETARAAPISWRRRLKITKFRKTIPKSLNSKKRGKNASFYLYFTNFKYYA